MLRAPGDSIRSTDAKELVLLACDRELLALSCAGLPKKSWPVLIAAITSANPGGNWGVSADSTERTLASSAAAAGSGSANMRASETRGILFVAPSSSDGSYDTPTANGLQSMPSDCTPMYRS